MVTITEREKDCACFGNGSYFITERERERMCMFWMIVTLLVRERGCACFGSGSYFITERERKTVQVLNGSYYIS